MTTTFTMAFDATAKNTLENANLIVGENGSLCQETVSNSSLDFNGVLCELFLLMRGSTQENIKDILDKVKNICDSNLLSHELRKEYLINLLKVVLYIREPRKGKGEKLVFYYCVEYLYELNGVYKSIAETCIKLIGNFGYYKDLNQMYLLFKNQDLCTFICDEYVNILYKDYNNLNTDNQLTLSGKWAPREGSQYDLMAKRLAYKLYEKCNSDKTTKYYDYTVKLK